MRRIPLAALLALCLVAVTASAAWAKETTVTLSDPPGGGIPSGQTWRADLDVVADPPEMLNEITLAPVVTVLNVDTGAVAVVQGDADRRPGQVHRRHRGRRRGPRLPERRGRAIPTARTSSARTRSPRRPATRRARPAARGMPTGRARASAQRRWLRWPPQASC